MKHCKITRHMTECYMFRLSVYILIKHGLFLSLKTRSQTSINNSYNNISVKYQNLLSTLFIYMLVFSTSTCNDYVGFVYPFRRLITLYEWLQVLYKLVFFLSFLFYHNPPRYMGKVTCH